MGEKMQEYGIFDVVGPKMIGPSSSHTAGAARIGRIARIIANKDVRHATFILHGSFAKTYKGHGTDRALLAGVLGILESDKDLKNAMHFARMRDVTYTFEEGDLGDVHSNTVKVIITKSTGEKVEVTGSSIGGGSIKVVELNGLPIEFTGEYTTLITRHDDSAGMIARVSDKLAQNEINIAFMRVFRNQKGADAFMVIETDQAIKETIMRTIRNEVKGIKSVYLLNPMK